MMMMIRTNLPDCPSMDDTKKDRPPKISTTGFFRKDICQKKKFISKSDPTAAIEWIYSEQCSMLF